MFWKFLISTMAAIAIFQLGALTVWVGLLSSALSAVGAIVLAVAVGCAGYYVWRRLKGVETPSS